MCLHRIGGCSTRWCAKKTSAFLFKQSSAQTHKEDIQMDQYHLHDDDDDEECYEYDEKDNDDDNAMMTKIPYM